MGIVRAYEPCLRTLLVPRIGAHKISRTTPAQTVFIVMDVVIVLRYG